MLVTWGRDFWHPGRMKGPVVKVGCIVSPTGLVDRQDFLVVGLRPLIDPAADNSLFLGRQGRALQGHPVRLEDFPDQARLGCRDADCRPRCAPFDNRRPPPEIQSRLGLVTEMAGCTVGLEDGKDIGLKDQWPGLLAVRLLGEGQGGKHGGSKEEEHPVLEDSWHGKALGNFPVRAWREPATFCPCFGREKPSRFSSQYTDFQILRWNSSSPSESVTTAINRVVRVFFFLVSSFLRSGTGCRFVTDGRRTNLEKDG